MTLHEAMARIERHAQQQPGGGATPLAAQPHDAVRGALLDIAQGVAFLHQQRIVHRDLKATDIENPAAVLLTRARPSCLDVSARHLTPLCLNQPHNILLAPRQNWGSFADGCVSITLMK